MVREGKGWVARLGRLWVGSRWCPGIVGSYETLGIPRDMRSALALFVRSPFDFERWAVSRINSQPNEKSKQWGDKGVDGVARF